MVTSRGTKTYGVEYLNPSRDTVTFEVEATNPQAALREAAAIAMQNEGGVLPDMTFVDDERANSMCKSAFRAHVMMREGQDCNG